MVRIVALAIVVEGTRPAYTKITADTIKKATLHDSYTLARLKLPLVERQVQVVRGTKVGAELYSSIVWGQVYARKENFRKMGHYTLTIFPSWKTHFFRKANKRG